MAVLCLLIKILNILFYSPFSFCFFFFFFFFSGASSWRRRRRRRYQPRGAEMKRSDEQKIHAEAEKKIYAAPLDEKSEDEHEENDLLAKHVI